MRFMMMVIPKGFEAAAPDTVPGAKAVAKMMEYNRSLQKAGVLLALDGLLRGSRSPIYPLGPDRLPPATQRPRRPVPKTRQVSRSPRRDSAGDCYDGKQAGAKFAVRKAQAGTEQ
jgi:hypothetical protein